MNRNLGIRDLLPMSGHRRRRMIGRKEKNYYYSYACINIIYREQKRDH